MLFSAYAPERNAMCAPGEVQNWSGNKSDGKKTAGLRIHFWGRTKIIIFLSSYAYAAFKAIFAECCSMLYKKNSKSLIIFFLRFPEIYSLLSIYKAIIKPELQVYGYFECSTSFHNSYISVARSYHCSTTMCASTQKTNKHYTFPLYAPNS